MVTVWKYSSECVCCVKFGSGLYFCAGEEPFDVRLLCSFFALIFKVWSRSIDRSEKVSVFYLEFGKVDETIYIPCEHSGNCQLDLD